MVAGRRHGLGHALTDMPTTRQTVVDEDIDLETVAEIITKKIHYRGASIRPGDIFDIAAAARHDRAGIVDALKAYRKDVARALTTIAHLNPDFVHATIAGLALKDSYRSVALTALEDARNLLSSV
jgi:hypothetical protein